MFVKARYLSAVLLLSSFAGLAQGHTHVTTPSTWKLNVAASDFGGGPVTKSEVYTIYTDTDKWAKWTDVAVDGSGKTLKTSWSGPQDGTMKPLVGMPGTMLSITTANDSQHEVMADGTTLDATFALAADKKKVTYKQTIKTKDGKVFHQTLVYERTK